MKPTPIAQAVWSVYGRMRITLGAAWYWVPMQGHKGFRYHILRLVGE